MSITRVVPQEPLVNIEEELRGRVVDALHVTSHSVKCHYDRLEGDGHTQCMCIAWYKQKTNDFKHNCMLSCIYRLKLNQQKITLNRKNVYPQIIIIGH